VLDCTHFLTVSDPAITTAGSIATTSHQVYRPGCKNIYGSKSLVVTCHLSLAEAQEALEELSKRRRCGGAAAFSPPPPRRAAGGRRQGPVLCSRLLFVNHRIPLPPHLPPQFG
jgi:hypothetical protein